MQQRNDESKYLYTYRIVDSGYHVFLIADTWSIEVMGLRILLLP